MIYRKVSACECRKSCLTTDFTRYKYYGAYMTKTFSWTSVIVILTTSCFLWKPKHMNDFWQKYGCSKWTCFLIEKANEDYLIHWLKAILQPSGINLGCVIIPTSILMTKLLALKMSTHDHALRFRILQENGGYIPPPLTHTHSHTPLTLVLIGDASFCISRR